MEKVEIYYAAILKMICVNHHVCVSFYIYVEVS
jgi:hypothetical protein